MKILTVVGARPQFVKAAAVSRVVAATDGVEELLVHTGQHYDVGLSDVFFDELEIPAPAYHLGIGSGLHGAQTGAMLAEIEKVIIGEKPDWVLVYGDTNSTLAGALAASKLHVPVAHVEAGLRSFNRRMPEEINRVLTDHVANLLFTPTEQADKNLMAEGITPECICRVGDVMYDATLVFGARARAASHILETLQIVPGAFVLATVHRAENTDDVRRLHTVFEALGRLHASVPVVLPLHPRTRAALSRAGLLDWAAERVRMLEPVGYFDMLVLEHEARLVVTDSGGMQKEAFFAGTPCVTLRDETEWTELVALGWNQLAPPTDADTVYGVLEDTLRTTPVARASPYGKGDSARQIVARLHSSK